jgi:hypothetical protein
MSIVLNWDEVPELTDDEEAGYRRPSNRFARARA